MTMMLFPIDDLDDARDVENMLRFDNTAAAWDSCCCTPVTVALHFGRERCCCCSRRCRLLQRVYLALQPLTRLYRCRHCCCCCCYSRSGGCCCGTTTQQ